MLGDIMGEGSRWNQYKRRSGRARYANSSASSSNLNSYSGSVSDSGSNKRVFISFHIEDEAQVELLRQQAKDNRFGIEFTDYSVKEPFDEKWKTQCTERIKQSSVLICMIGPETYQREAVLWEINKAYELGKKVIGVRIYRNETHKVPQSMIENNAKIINWDLDKLSKEIESG